MRVPAKSYLQQRRARRAAGAQSGAGVRVWRIQLSCSSATHAPPANNGPCVLLACQARVARAESIQSLQRRLQVAANNGVKCSQNVCLDSIPSHETTVSGRVPHVHVSRWSIRDWIELTAAPEPQA